MQRPPPCDAGTALFSTLKPGEKNPLPPGHVGVTSPLMNLSQAQFAWTNAALRIQFLSFIVMRTRLFFSLGLVLACTGASHAAEKKSYTLGMIGKSQGNQFFEAARSGANAAARELGSKYG